MRSRLISGPVWVHMTFSGVVFGVLTTARLVLQDLAWDEAVLAGVVQGAFFGLVFGWWSHRQAEQGRAVLDALPSARRREAVRAASRGPAPVDPGVRAVALDLVRDQQAQLRRQRPLGSVVLLGFVSLTAYVAISSSPWYWLAVGLFAAASIGVLVLVPRRLHTRARVLQPSAATR